MDKSTKIHKMFMGMCPPASPPPEESTISWSRQGRLKTFGHLSWRSASGTRVGRDQQRLLLAKRLLLASRAAAATGDAFLGAQICCHSGSCHLRGLPLLTSWVCWPCYEEFQKSFSSSSFLHNKEIFCMAFLVFIYPKNIFLSCSGFLFLSLQTCH